MNQVDGFSKEWKVSIDKEEDCDWTSSPTPEVLYLIVKREEVFIP